MCSLNEVMERKNGQRATFVEESERACGEGGQGVAMQGRCSV